MPTQEPRRPDGELEVCEQKVAKDQSQSQPQPSEEIAERNGTVPQLGEVDLSFYLIGVGASAGGLDAIKAFLSPVPGNCIHSFVFVQHLSPDYKSLMGELLRRETSLVVKEIRDDIPVDPGHVYIVPPKANVIIRGTLQISAENPSDDHAAVGEDATDNKRTSGLRFSLIKQPHGPELNFPIDLFFESLAEAAGNRAVGVVLSGTGTDGSRGLRAIKDADGIVIAQSPETAEFGGMPQAAAATRLVDFILPPDEMVRELTRYFSSRHPVNEAFESLFADADATFKSILEIIGNEASIDFLQYKKPTLKRRIVRRMTINRCDTLDDYLKILQQDTNEAPVLCQEFLVGVTHFFRDLPAWETLRTKVLPDLFAQHEGDEPIKVWSVGCSTGEEAYTIALLIEAYIQDAKITKEFRILATDVNPKAISIAKQGLYPETALDDVPQEIAKRFFSRIRGGVTIDAKVRQKVIFSQHNAVEMPPYSHTDLIICRNVLIYMSQHVQAQVLSTFSYSLKTGGWLFLGASESIQRGASRLGAVDTRWRIYKSISKGQRRHISKHQPQYFAPYLERPAISLRAGPEPTLERLDSALLQQLLEGVNTCILMVDERLTLIESYGDYRKFLCLPEKGFSARLLDLVPKKLNCALTMSLRQAEKEGAGVCGPISVSSNENDSWLVWLNCQRIISDAGATVFAVCLRREKEQASHHSGQRIVETIGSADEVHRQANYAAELEAELALTREGLETTVQDLGVTNEELQSSNEELQSSNEELMSANEELQSVNEEIHSVNAELSEKIGELEGAYTDIDNLLNSTDLATVFLDEDLRIRRFCDSIKTQFQLDSNDIGRPLAHFSSSLEQEANKRIHADAELALATGETKSYEVKGVDGSWYLARIQPYTHLEGVAAGVILNFVDVTELKGLQVDAKLQRDRLEGLLESGASGYWDWDIRDKTQYLSPCSKALLGYESHELESKADNWQRIIHRDDLSVFNSKLDNHVASRGKLPFDNEIRFLHKDGSIVWMTCRGKVIEWGQKDEPLRMFGCHIDITNLKKREQKTQVRAEEFLRIAYASAHDLREPMSTIEGYIELLEEELGEKIGEMPKRLMNTITKASKRTRSQVEGMLDYTRLQDEEVEFESVDIKLLLEEIVTDLEESIKEAGAKVIVNDLPPALGFQPLLRRLMQDLLSNAIKFRSSKRQLVVTIDGIAAKQGMNAYAITDNGIGIEPKYREKVFEIFNRLNSRSKYEGNGLGLAYCKKIIALHEGTIRIDDGHDGGTKVIFKLKKAEGT